MLLGSRLPFVDTLSSFGFLQSSLIDNELEKDVVPSYRGGELCDGSSRRRRRRRRSSSDSIISRCPGPFPVQTQRGRGGFTGGLFHSFCGQVI